MHDAILVAILTVFGGGLGIGAVAAYLWAAQELEWWRTRRWVRRQLGRER